LSTHVLDLVRGGPAAGVPLTLDRIERGEVRVRLVSATTNADGRTDAPLLADAALLVGTYELVFDVADYFSGGTAPSASPPFLDRIPIRFSVADPEAGYHVPLLVSPWSYSTYRGS
jgi:hydroxyisourate hydrolase